MAPKKARQLIIPLENNFSNLWRDLGHLHSKLKVPGLTCPGWESNLNLRGGRRVLKKRAIRTAF
jgi:hypothetical protein